MPLLIPGLVLVGLIPIPELPAVPSASCFVLPGASAGVTESYLTFPGGSVRLAGRVRAEGYHVRAAFHPDGQTLYITVVEWSGYDGAMPGIRLLARAYDPRSCEIGPSRGELRPGAQAPNSERVYGLLVHPNGRFLYQSTASLGRIRLYDLDESGVPAFRTTFDATAGGTVTCAQVRRLALHPAQRILYANCNNRDAGEGTDHALQAWRIGDDGALSLLQHHTLQHMDGGIFDPVPHPSGDWLYQPLSSTEFDALQGPGPYIQVFHTGADGRLEWYGDIKVRLPGTAAGVAGNRLEQAYPVTMTLGDGATTAYAALHVIIDWEHFAHGYAVFDVEEEGGALRQRSSVAFDPELEGSSHHGGTLVEVGEETYWLSYLTDYGNRQGGAVLRYRVRRDGSLEALPGGPVITGVTDGRQLIAAPIAAAAGSSSGDHSPDSSAHEQEQRTAPSLPACDDRVALTAADAWSGELGQDMTVCLDMDLDAGEFVRAKALVEVASPIAGLTMETWGPDSTGAINRSLLLRPTAGSGTPPVPISWSAAGTGTHTLLLRNYWSFEHPERPASASVWIEMVESPELARARRRALEGDDRVAWLRDHAVSLRTVSPEDDDLSDLMPLRNVLGGVRVVLLGESTHGSGTDLLAKTRLVKFLHEELGYDVLALESGLYEMSVAWDSLRGGSPGFTALELGTWGLWTRSRQMQPLIRYLEEQAGGVAPLEITGFDNQFLFRRASAGFVEDLARALSSRGISSRLVEDGDPVRAALQAMAEMRFRRGEEAPPAPTIRRDVIEELRRAAAELAGFEDAEAGFWREVLEGRACHARRVWAETIDDVSLPSECFRDRQMARHLIWLARERYPDRKIIVWAATAHVMRTDTMSAAAGPGPSMGRMVSDALGEQTYTLSTTSYGGTFGLPNGRPPQQIVSDQDPRFELEELMAAAGFDYAFVDVRDPGARKSWLGGRFLARPDGHQVRERAWSEILDGLLFIREQNRSRGLDPR